MTDSTTLPLRLAVAYRRALAGFMPPAMADDREAQNRAAMFLISHTIGPALGSTVPLALWAFDPTPGPVVAVLATSIALFWAFPFLLRRGVAYEVLVVLSVANLNFAILWSCYHYGGVASPTLPWVLVIPILSLFYIGGERQLQSRLLAVTAAAIAIFAGAYVLIPPPHPDVPAAAMQGLGAVSTVATLLYVAVMAVYYARIFDAGVDLEVEMQRRQAMAEELRRAVLAADRSGSAKSEFLARMSHEIRTPLNAIVGYGQLLEEEAEETGDAALRADVERILDAGRYLVRLIDMILDLSKIEAGRMTFDPRPHAIGDLLAAAVDARRGEVEANDVRLTVDVGPGLEAVAVDGTRLLQVVDGLLDNALSHAVGGTVALIAAAGVEGGRPVVLVKVSDTGGGIPPEVLATLFETFSTSREASGGRYGGTGLNLTVCSRLCRAMGGSLSVESELGRGATFTVALPRCEKAGAARPALRAA